MKIDAHQHFWQYDAQKHAWIDDNMARIRQDFLPKDLKPLLDEAGINGTVAVQADESLDENDFLLDLSQKNPWIKKVVGWVDLCAGDVTDHLEKHSQNPKMAGFRMILQGQPPELMASKAFRNGIAQLEKYGYTYDILIFPRHLKAAIDLVKYFPHQPFVIDHLAKPYIKDGKLDEWALDMYTMASFDNVSCKVSGMVTEADWKGWKQTDFMPYLDVIMEAFGPKRLMYGSDWPVALVAAEYGQALSIVQDYIKRLSPAEQEEIMGQAACRFYGIE